MTPERIVGLLVLLLPVMSALGVGAFHATKWFVERRDKTKTPPAIQPIQGMAVPPPPETPLEALLKQQAVDLRQERDDARAETGQVERELARVRQENALNREELARHGWTFAEVHPSELPSQQEDS